MHKSSSSNKRKRRDVSPSPSYSESSSRAVTPALSDAGSNDDFESISKKISNKLQPVKQSEFERLKAKLDAEYNVKVENLGKKLTKHFSKKTQNRASQKLLERDDRVKGKRQTKKAKRNTSKSQTPVQASQLMASPQTSNEFMQTPQLGQARNANPAQVTNPNFQSQQMFAPTQMPGSSSAHHKYGAPIPNQNAMGTTDWTQIPLSSGVKKMVTDDPRVLDNLSPDFFKKLVGAQQTQSQPTGLAQPEIFNSNSLKTLVRADSNLSTSTMVGNGSNPNLITQEEENELLSRPEWQKYLRKPQDG
jgi:hypothetical protein